MKRRKDVLTGGTGDVSPQYLSGKAKQSGSDVLTSVAIPLPINRYPQGGRESVTIMEVLRLYADIPLLPISAGPGNLLIEIFFSTKDPQGAILEIGDPEVFAKLGTRQSQAQATAVGFVMIHQDKPLMWDFTDGAGHGVLLATDTIYATTRSFNTGFPNEIEWKMLYRFKTVSLAEYIGIVQSQS